MKRRPKHPDKLSALIAKKKGVLLDVSLGGQPQERALTLRPQADADVPHHPCDIPWPIPDGCVHTAVITHVLEYLEPACVFDWFNELWRVLQPKGVAYLSGPYGGDDSQGWLSDPQHRTRIIEPTFLWLDPRGPLYALHATVGRKTPKPFWTLQQARSPGTQGSISYNVVIQSRPLDEVKP